MTITGLNLCKMKTLQKDVPHDKDLVFLQCLYRPKQCGQTVAEHEMRELLSPAVINPKQLESGAVVLQFGYMRFSRVACPFISKPQMHPEDGKWKGEKRKANAILDFH